MEFGDVPRMARSMGTEAIDKNQSLKVRLLYIAGMGLEHPLVQSQVIRYLKGLAEVCESCQLVTFERDSSSSPSREALAESLRSAGIQWHPVARY